MGFKGIGKIKAYSSIITAMGLDFLWQASTDTRKIVKKTDIRFYKATADS